MTTPDRERALAEAAKLDLASQDFLEREFQIWDLLRQDVRYHRLMAGRGEDGD